MKITLNGLAGKPEGYIKNLQKSSNPEKSGGEGVKMSISSDEIKEIMAELTKPLPNEGIQRTEKAKTKKGYDTVGYKSQYVINRFNEVLGAKWGFDYRILKENEGKYGSGNAKFEIIVEMSIWIIEKTPEYIRSGIGGHTSFTYVDAMKGALSNALKSTARYFGIGRQAWEDTVDIDDDYTKCAFEDKDSHYHNFQQESGKKQQNSNDHQQTSNQQQSKDKQGTTPNGSGNGNGITSQKLCGMVATITNQGKDKDDKSNYVELFIHYLRKQYNIDSLSLLSRDQLIEAKDLVSGAGKERPNDFRTFLKGYEKYLSSQKPDTKISLIQTIRSKLTEIFQGNRDKLDFYFSGLDTSIATIEDLSKLPENDLIEILNKVEITYNEHFESQEAGALN